MAGEGVCDAYMGIHRAFAKRMLQLGEVSGDGAKSVPPVANYTVHCEHDTFDYTKLGEDYFYEPKPCVENALWVKHHRMWIGEEGSEEVGFEHSKMRTCK